MTRKNEMEPTKFGEGITIESLMTAVRRIEYDFETRTGILHMPKHCCVDMDGCIGFFKLLDSNVQMIYTFAGQTEDTMYSEYRGKWSAHLARIDFIADGDRRI